MPVKCKRCGSISYSRRQTCPDCHASLDTWDKVFPTPRSAAEMLIELDKASDAKDATILKHKKTIAELQALLEIRDDTITRLKARLVDQACNT